MAYNPQNKILFVHIPKNAGKSLEHALGFASQAKINNPGLFRSKINRVFKKLHYATNNRKPAEILLGPLDMVLCAQHLSLIEIESLQLITPQQLKDSRKFAVVRNPFDRAISAYRRFHAQFELDDFKRFWSHRVDTVSQDHAKTVFYRSQYSYVANLDGDISVDRILKFENLHEEFAGLCSDWGLGDLSLKHIGKRRDNFQYYEVLDDEARQILEERFAKDLRVFGYSY